MRLPALARTTHKWFGLIVGIQAVIWTFTGIYMTAVHIDIIHGDRLVRAAETPPIAMQGQVQPTQLVATVPGFKGARLETQLGRPVYIVDGEDGSQLVDATTGARLSPLGEAAVRQRAKAMFAEDGAIVSAQLLTDTVPIEIQTRTPPIWRVEFEGAWRPTFYISPATGELVSRRHDLWRTFDFLWSLHIMDYEKRTDVNNILLRVFTWLTVASAASGGWLLIYSFRKRRRPRRAV